MYCLKRFIKQIWKQIAHNWAIIMVGTIVLWIIFSGFEKISDNQFSLFDNQEKIYEQCKPFRI